MDFLGGFLKNNKNKNKKERARSFLEKLLFLHQNRNRLGWVWQLGRNGKGQIRDRK